MKRVGASLLEKGEERKPSPKKDGTKKRREKVSPLAKIDAKVAGGVISAILKGKFERCKGRVGQEKRKRGKKAARSTLCTWGKPKTSEKRNAKKSGSLKPLSWSRQGPRQRRGINLPSVSRKGCREKAETLQPDPKDTEKKDRWFDTWGRCRL